MKTTVVVLGADDADDLLKLQNATYAAERDSEGKHLRRLAQSPQDVALDLADRHMLALGLRDDQGRLVAGVRAYVGSPTAQIGRLCVHPDVQGRGLATRLLGALEEQMPEHVREVHSFTDENAADASRFYAKLGYLEERHEDMEAGFHIVQLSKKVVVRQPV